MIKNSTFLQKTSILICFVLLLIVGWNLFFNGIPLDKFNKVEHGMSYEEVAKLIGRGKEVVAGEFQHERQFVYEYQLKNDFIGYITFWRGDDGTLRVTCKETSFPQEQLSRIKMGMSLEEVETLIGPGADVGSSTTIYEYQLKDGNVGAVVFEMNSEDGKYYVSAITIRERN